MPQFNVMASQTRKLSKVMTAPNVADLSDMLIADMDQLETAYGWVVDPYSIEEAIEKITEVTLVADIDEDLSKGIEDD